MRAVELTLFSISLSFDDIGVEIPSETAIVVPIIKQTSILHEEYYEANQQGLKPEVRFVISSLNYDNQTELEYMGIRYSIIRATITNPDEISLICEKKIGNVNQKSINK